jgi:hypothetical protein
MQNIDYSRKLRRDNLRQNSNPETKYSQKSVKKNNSLLNLFQNNSQPISFLYLFIGAVLLFTSGIVIGIKIDQKEAYFNESENSTIRNTGKTSLEEQTSTEEEEISQTKRGKGTENKAELSENYTADPNTQKTTKSTLPINNKDLKYPPRLNQINYIIQLGTFSKSEANKWASILIKDKQDLQGRFFRTASGKMYIGYYYSLKDAKLSLRAIKKVKDGSFEESSIKNVEF